MKLSSKKRNYLPAIFPFAMAALVLLFCSKSSPLFPMNDWVDVNCFFTVGKSILHGIVPYRDLYEQKGPVLYFMYALAALVSHRSFFGVYLLEVACFGLFLYYCQKIAGLYLKNSLSIYLTVAVLAAVIPVSPAFAHGGGAEELTLFTLAYGLYSVLQALHEKRQLTFREAFLNGIFAAMVLYIKFTILGFYIGLVLFVILWYLTDRFRWKELLATAGQFLLGVAAVSAVVFLYFLICGAVDDFLTVYFYNNLFLYPQETGGTRLELILACLKATLTRNTSYRLLILGGALLFAMELRRSWRDLPMALLTFAGLTAGTYWGGRGYTYYGLILSVFAVFGIVALLRVVELLDIPGLLNRYCKRLVPLLSALVLILSMDLSLIYSYQNSRNLYLASYAKEDLPAYRFAQTINQVENARILNYGFLDGGFYYAADVLPTCEFFCTLNINAPDMWSTQRQCINNGEVDFVITRRYELSRYSANADLYTLVDQATFWFEGVDFTYYLYQKLP